MVSIVARRKMSTQRGNSPEQEIADTLMMARGQQRRNAKYPNKKVSLSKGMNDERLRRM